LLNNQQIAITSDNQSDKDAAVNESGQVVSTASAFADLFLLKYVCGWRVVPYFPVQRKIKNDRACRG